MLEELLLDGDVVVRDAEDDHAVFGLALLLGERRVGLATKVAIANNLFGLIGLTTKRELGHQFILNKDECLHGVLEGELVLSHLTQDRADIQVDVARI